MVVDNFFSWFLVLKRLIFLTHIAAFILFCIPLDKEIARPCRRYSCAHNDCYNNTFHHPSIFAILDNHAYQRTDTDKCEENVRSKTRSIPFFIWISLAIFLHMCGWWRSSCHSDPPQYCNKKKVALWKNVRKDNMIAINTYKANQKHKCVKYRILVRIKTKLFLKAEKEPHINAYYCKVWGVIDKFRRQIKTHTITQTQFRFACWNQTNQRRTQKFHQLL